VGSIRLRRTSVRLILCSLVALALVAPAGPVAAGADLPGRFLGHSWGSFANAKAGDIATQLGRSAYIPCPCVSEGTNGETLTNTVTNLRVRDDIFYAGVMDTTLRAGKQPTAQALMTAEITDLSALDGAIRADVIRAVARTNATATDIATGTRGSRFVNLRIFGTAIADDVRANTRVSLPGFGYARLRETIRRGDGVNRESIQLTMIRIVITRTNVLDIPVGTQIHIGRAKSGYDRSEVAAVVGGSAWGTEAVSTLASVENRVGRAALITVGCLGTNGEVIQNNVNLLRVRGVLRAATVYSTAQGDVFATSAYARLTNRVENLNLLGGTVTADLVKAVARTSWDTTTDSGSNSTEGSRFVNLRVLGTAVGDNVPPNTSVDLAGIGTLWLNRQDTHADGDDAWARVVMIQLNLSAENPFGLPAGTKIIISRARSEAAEF